MITVRSDDGYLMFERDGVEFYDTAIPAQADVGRMIRHLGDKNWMMQELKIQTIRIIDDYYADQQKK